MRDVLIYDGKVETIEPTAPAPTPEPPSSWSKLLDEYEDAAREQGSCSAGPQCTRCGDAVSLARWAIVAKLEALRVGSSAVALARANS